MGAGRVVEGRRQKERKRCLVRSFQFCWRSGSFQVSIRPSCRYVPAAVACWGMAAGSFRNACQFFEGGHTLYRVLRRTSASGWTIPIPAQARPVCMGMPLLADNTHWYSVPNCPCYPAPRRTPPSYPARCERLLLVIGFTLTFASSSRLADLPMSPGSFSNSR